jgi:hypothetical protein
MMVGTVTFFILKNKYVVTPEGRPIGGLPKHNTLKILKKEKHRLQNSLALLLELQQYYS